MSPVSPLGAYHRTPLGAIYRTPLGAFGPGEAAAAIGTGTVDLWANFALSPDGRTWYSGQTPEDATCALTRTITNIGAPTVEGWLVNMTIALDPPALLPDFSVYQDWIITGDTSGASLRIGDVVQDVRCRSGSLETVWSTARWTTPANGDSPDYSLTAGYTTIASFPLSFRQHFEPPPFIQGENVTVTT